MENITNNKNIFIEMIVFIVLMGNNTLGRENKKYHIGNNTPTDEGNDIVLLSNNYRYFGKKSNDDYKNKYPTAKRNTWKS